MRAIVSFAIMVVVLVIAFVCESEQQRLRDESMVRQAEIDARTWHDLKVMAQQIADDQAKASRGIDLPLDSQMVWLTADYKPLSEREIKAIHYLLQNPLDAPE